MPSSVARRQRMAERLEALGLPYTIARATDARHYTTEDIDAMKRAGVLHPDVRCSLGSIGCALSHVEIYRRIVAENIEFAVVLEDDVTLSPELPEILPELEAAVPDGEIALLFCINEYIRGPAKVLQLSSYNAVRLSRSHQLHYPLPAKLHCTAGYALTKATAARMLSVVSPIRFPPDVWSIWRSEGAIDSIRVVHPFAVVEENAGSERIVRNDERQSSSGGYRSVLAMGKHLLRVIKRPWNRLTSILSRRRATRAEVVSLVSPFDPSAANATS